jgi:TonB-linked SusC/RagA family outer membrane protein
VRYPGMIVALVLGLLWAGAAGPAFAQETGAIVVTVKAKQSGAGLGGAQVTLTGTRQGGVTDPNGRYLLAQVPAGNHEVRVSYLGYAEMRRTNVEVRPGQTVTLDFELEEAVLSLQEIVVTGVTDPTAGVKLPFTVARVGSEQLQVASTGSPLEMLAGKVAGAYIQRTSGKPGADVDIQLRSPTAFETSGRPLFVVDGVVVATENMDSPLSDIDPNEIEHIEIIKGAAAASLYGSRAAGGVISVTTNRGQNLDRGTTRITSRMEIGRNFIAREIPVTNAHMLRMDSLQTTLVNAAGVPIGWNQRIVDPATRRMFIYDYPGQQYDNIKALYNPGQYLTNNVSFSQSADNTTLMLTLSRRDDQGALEGNRGRQQYNGRMSVDHRLADKLSVSIVGQHSKVWDDSESGNPYTSILTYPTYVDLRKKDANGNFLMVPDSSVEVENPLWRQTSRDNWDYRVRTMASLNTRYTLARWATLDAQLSYDRADSKSQIYVPKGVPTSATTDAPSLGRLQLWHQENNAMNGSLGATFRRQFADLNARLTTRGTFEKEWREGFAIDGRDFIVKDTRDLSGTREAYDWYSNTVDIRANGVLADLGLDYADRYIGSLLIRHDGSSLFGPLNKWHTYKRASAKWRISQESFFHIPAINELAIRYAMGEAGGRPGFAHQYEAWNLSRSAGLTRENAGNPQLRPSFTREQEIGLDFIGFRNKIQLELVYAHQVSRDQIIIVPATVATGYSSLRANAGELVGNTLEATLRWNAIRNRNTRLSFNAVGDNTNTTLTKWERSCFWGSNTAREHEYTCAGQKMGQFWIFTFLKDTQELPSWLQGRADEFDVNDHGYLVWVGKNPETGQSYTWKDGLKLSSPTECPADAVGGCGWGSYITEGGYTYRWGEPFLMRDEEGILIRQNHGSSLPDLNFGFGSQLTHKRFSASAQFRGQIGGKIYNRARNYAYATLRHGDIDMRNVPDELKKTQDYFNRALGQSDSCNAMNCGSYYDEFLEDATHLKMSELRVAYRFNREALRRVFGSVAPSDLNVGLNTTELFTLHNYRGIDPSRGRPLSRQEIVNYPHLRTLRLTFDLTF